MNTREAREICQDSAKWVSKKMILSMAYPILGGTDSLSKTKTVD